MKKKVSLVNVVLLASLLTTVIAVIMVQRQITQTGSIAAVGNMQIYWDAACTQIATTHDWGVLVEGAILYKDVYIRSEGANTPLKLTYSCTGFDGCYDWHLYYYGVDIDHAKVIYNLQIDGAIWRTTETKTLGIGAVLKVTMRIQCLDGSTVMTFAFSTIFTAQE